MKVPCSITVLLGCWDCRKVIEHSAVFLGWSAVLKRMHCFISMSTRSVFIFLTVTYYVGQQYVGNTMLRYDNVGNANAPHCYVVGTLRVLLQDKMTDFHEREANCGVLYEQRVCWPHHQSVNCPQQVPLVQYVGSCFAHTVLHELRSPLGFLEQRARTALDFGTLYFPSASCTI